MDTHLIASFSNLMLLGEFSFGGLLESLYNIAKVALGIGFVIFIHELGHFVAAKLCGVKCEKFYVGFDPPLKYLPSSLCKFQWGETEYGLGIIPLGGYVKMLGQDDNPARAAEEAERSKIVTTTPDGQEHVAMDPRSYVSKSVPQRMFIISAGVIMNLISAVFLAATAYYVGVDITPVEIRGSAPGDPAWVRGLLPGDKVIQIGDKDQDEADDEYMRWRWEFQNEVVKSGITSDGAIHAIDMKIRNAKGDERWETIHPSDRQKHILKAVTVGVHAAMSNRVANVIEGVINAEPPIEPGDRVVAVDGKPLSKELANEAGDIPSIEIDEAFVRKVDQPIILTLERTGKDGTIETVESVVAPRPRKSLGIVMKIGPVVAVRSGSSAEAAGFETGDILKSIQGEPIGDPLTLPYRLPSDKTLVITALRKGKEVSLSVDQDLDAWNALYDSVGARMSLETIGLAYEVSRVVAEVLPNSPAAKSGEIKVGDEVTTMQWVAEGDAHKAAIKRYGKKYNTPLSLDDQVRTWVYANARIQLASPEIEFRVTVERNEVKKEVRLAAYELADGHYPDRGIAFATMERVHTAENLGDAFKLGLRETGEKITEVWSVLIMLFTGQLDLNNLGGPVLIATVAGSEASVGIPRLLIFLTFLSANLAILNFLPIPVLDGGHMVFLMLEGVLGRPVPERIQAMATFGGFCLLMALMVFVFANDLSRLFGS